MKTIFKIALLPLLLSVSAADDKSAEWDSFGGFGDRKKHGSNIGYGHEERRAEWWKTDRACEEKPEKCVVKTYGLTPYGNPDIGLKNPQTVIEFDPETGRGKVYKSTMFGDADKMSEALAEVKKTASGELTVYPYDKFGTPEYFKPSQIIEIDKSHEKPKEGKIYGVDQFGFKDWMHQSGAATVECK